MGYKKKAIESWRPPTHKDMNGQVLRDDGPRLSGNAIRRGDKASRDNEYNACLPIELSETKEGCRRMVIHVQKG